MAHGSINKMEPKPYVNGVMLPNNIGRSVCAIGKVTMNSPQGDQLKVQLSDGKEVQVHLGDRLDEPLEGYIQMIAEVNRDLSLAVQSLVSFGSGEIDLSIYDQVVNVMNHHPNLFSASELNGITI